MSFKTRCFFIRYELLTERNLKHVARRPQLLQIHQFQDQSIDDSVYQRVLAQVDSHLHDHNLKYQY